MPAAWWASTCRFEMAKLAARRQLYDELVVGELTAFLEVRPRAWDLIVSTTR